MLVITVYSPPPPKKTYIKYLQAVRHATQRMVKSAIA
jgi:hypothetical protein